MNDMNEIPLTLRQLIRLVIECKANKWNTYVIDDEDEITFFTIELTPNESNYFKTNEWFGVKKYGNDIVAVHKDKSEVKTFEQLISWVKGTVK